MFQKHNELYSVGEIIRVCWHDKSGNHEARGRLVQVKADIKPPYEKPYIKFVVVEAGKAKQRLSLVLTNDIHLEHVN